MRIRKVRVLYTIKTKNGKNIPRGVYSIDSPKGIPPEVMKEAEKEKSFIVEVLQYEKNPNKPIKSEVTTIDENQDVIETADVVIEEEQEEEEVEKDEEKQEEEKPVKPAAKRTVKRRTTKSKAPEKE